MSVSVFFFLVARVARFSITAEEGEEEVSRDSTEAMASAGSAVGVARTLEAPRARRLVMMLNFMSKIGLVE